MIALFLVLLAAPAAAAGVTEPERAAITETLVGAMRDTLEAVQDAMASAMAGAAVKEALARQRVAGRPARADRKTVEAELRLVMRANTGRLAMGRRWRPFPSDEAFAKRAEAVAAGLEAHVAGLGPVRSWNCSYDKEAETLVNGSIGALARSSMATLDKQAPRPPYAGLEARFRHGPRPDPLEPEPVRDEASAAWCDWAAAREAGTVLSELRRQRSDLESKKGPKPRLRPDAARVREAVRLWARAAALEAGRPAVDAAPEKLDAAAKRISDAVSKKYGAASSKSLLDCRVEEAVASLIGGEAKTLR